MTKGREIKIAILDLYNGIANQAIRSFEDILDQYSVKHAVKLNLEVFNVRERNEVPGTDFDIYISSGGPGNPFTANEDWDKNYFKLIDDLAGHNASDAKNKKHVLFICHSFQLMCRRFHLSEVSLRNMPSFGVLPVNVVNDGENDHLFKGMPNPFYAVDSRSWQVVNADMEAFAKLGAKILAIEQERTNDSLPRALMAIRFKEYFIGTQFHPEFGPEVMQKRLMMEDNKRDVINEWGEAGYKEMLSELNDADKLVLTFNNIVFNFLDEAILHNTPH
jgi:GMP synthase-like glutamine amidotransferase